MSDMPPPQMPEDDKPWWRQWWVPLVAVFAVLVAVGAALGEVVEEPEEVSSPAAADEPEVTEAPATEEAPVAAAGPVTIEGSDGNTPPFELPAGRHTVTIETSGDCVFGLNLRTLDDKRAESLPSVEGNSSTTGELYGLDGGEYFIEAFTGPPERCSWAVTFDPRG